MSYYEQMKSLSKHNISTIKANNINYHYISKEIGETIFLLHGFPDTASTWDSFIDVLS
jgi:pimeloyl-ACP methyl ester carboxylesterase